MPQWQALRVDAGDPDSALRASVAGRHTTSGSPMLQPAPTVLSKRFRPFWTSLYLMEPLLCDHLFGFLWAGLRENRQWYWVLSPLLDLCCALPINFSVSGTWTCSVCRRHHASHSSCPLVPVLKAQVRIARRFSGQTTKCDFKLLS